MKDVTMSAKPILCAECKALCEDKTEYAVFKCYKGWYALHRWCVEPFMETLVSQRPYEQYDLAPELWLDAEAVNDGWQHHQKAGA
jgi:hypothetical protein